VEKIPVNLEKIIVLLPCRRGRRPALTAGGVLLLSTMLFDSHSLHVALGPGPPRCAGPAALRRLHRPPVAVAPLTTGVHQGVSPQVYAKVASPTLPRSLNTRALNVARLLQPGHRALTTPP